MAGTGKFRRFWNRDEKTRGLIVNLTINIIAGAIVTWATSIQLGRIGIVWWIALILLGQVAFLIHAFIVFFGTPRQPRLLAAGQVPDGSESAYILLDVEPGTSNEVVKKLSEHPNICYAAAVWGQWDVIARVEAGTAGALVELLNTVQSYGEVRRTETQLVRNEQVCRNERNYNSSRPNDSYAFLLLKVKARDLSNALDKLRTVAHEDGRARVQHAAGIFGSYDIVVTVRYANDGELAEFVMKYSQFELKADTMTMPAVRGITFIRG